MFPKEKLCKEENQSRQSENSIGTKHSGRLAPSGCRTRVWWATTGGRGCRVLPGGEILQGKLRQSGIKIQLAPNNDTGWHHLVAGGVQSAPWGEIVQARENRTTLSKN